MTSAKPRKRVVLTPDQVINGYKIKKQLGSGGFGDIYSVYDTSDSNKLYAMKIEPIDDSPDEDYRTEVEVIKQLKDDVHFPNIKDCGMLNDSHRYFIMTLFGPSLSLMRRMMNHCHFCAYTTTQLAIDMLNCIEVFHNKGFIHNDIKPANFVIQPNSKSPLALIDFGFSYSYIDPRTQQHIIMRKDAGFTGTTCYASINAHNGYTLSRRDDLFSWFYSVMELSEGSLPWENDDLENAMKKKKKINLEEICYSLPDEFVKVYKYINSLKFEDEPNYKSIRHELKKALKGLKDENKSIKYEWETLDNDIVRTISDVPLNIPDINEGVENCEEEQSEENGIELAYGGCTNCILI